ncbi:MAG: glycoside hydrolase family 2 [Sulfobacillus acidophilus]|uniref:Glycoside hydrolase family 2 n=1 Tax=Sulfobacillus acidophilus TaxID=53633 RepID=A0A2T2WCG2_9FIRM|nr:MAG: glycoside hydrolase family 2 [Sulfobacillus acidophilus]
MTAAIHRKPLWIAQEVERLQNVEYPNPLCQRDQWMDLSGEWEFEVDPENRGVVDEWFRREHFSRRIQVPYAPETPKSGFGEDPGAIFWYRKEVTITSAWRGQRVMLYFGAVDYEASVWVNGVFVGSHKGGYTPFSCDITPWLFETGLNAIVVRVYDDPRDQSQPRGKQTWEDKPAGILYTRTSGIWQPVWMAAEPQHAVHQVNFFTHPDQGAMDIEVTVSQPIPSDRKARVEVVCEGHDGQPVFTTSIAAAGDRIKMTTSLDWPGGVQWWSPDHPHLYVATVRLMMDGQSDDVVRSYFGVRTVETRNQQVLINHQPVKFRMILHQGYYPEAGLSGSEEHFREDILLLKAMGFNALRMHQKIEDPRFLYWCDRLGMMVWEEMPSAYAFNQVAIQRLVDEWVTVVRRDMGHPSIVAWVPFNESWGVTHIAADGAQQHYARALYHVTKALDPDRLVVDNDGWEHTVTDLMTVHDYTQDPAELEERYSSVSQCMRFRPANRVIMLDSVEGNVHQPVLVTECGGIALNPEEGWGYAVTKNESDLLTGYQAIIGALNRSPIVQGWCYTQFTDVEQEQNGLLTIDRRPKVPLELIRAVNAGEKPPATRFNMSPDKGD